MTASRSVLVPTHDLSGSRLRCLLLTHGVNDAVARLLTTLAEPFAVVGADDFWMPRGFLQPTEAKIEKVKGFLSTETEQAVTRWWLERSRRANTPNWDLASTATIQGRRGLVLVEAKAHRAELGDAGKRPGHPRNDRSISAAIEQANYGLNSLVQGWNLAANSHYQLANRFAWSWKRASLGVSAFLVYLGFLNADEMAPRREPFRSV